jgi:molybdenum cofactor biosynthesis enzyme
MNKYTNKGEVMYQAKHAAPKKKRGNRHTPTIWLLASVATYITVELNINRLASASLTTSFIHLALATVALEAVYAVAIAAFAVWNLDREAKRTKRILERL